VTTYPEIANSQHSHIDMPYAGGKMLTTHSVADCARSARARDLFDVDMLVRNALHEMGNKPLGVAA
jgi:hypothetical protein